MDSYFEDYSAYDEVAESLKEALRESVTAEITARLNKLTAENIELRDKVKNLKQLETEVSLAKANYERETASARRDALSIIRKEKLSELLSAIDEHLYTVETKQVPRDKCDRCNEDRRIPYKTPLGKDELELCDCAYQDSVWFVDEAIAHEVSRQNGELRVFWHAVSKRYDHDYIISPRWLKPAGGVDPEEIMKSPREYSFKDIASAQAVADLLNTKSGKNSG